MARILGKEGKITKAIRQIMTSVGYFKIGKRVVIEIIEVPDIVKNLND